MLRVVTAGREGAVCTVAEGCGSRTLPDVAQEGAEVVAQAAGAGVALQDCGPRPEPGTRGGAAGPQWPTSPSRPCLPPARSLRFYFVVASHHLLQVSFPTPSSCLHVQKGHLMEMKLGGSTLSSPVLYRPSQGHCRDRQPVWSLFCWAAGGHSFPAPSPPPCRELLARVPAVRLAKPGLSFGRGSLSFLSILERVFIPALLPSLCQLGLPVTVFTFVPSPPPSGPCFSCSAPLVHLVPGPGPFPLCCPKRSSHRAHAGRGWWVWARH